MANKIRLVASIISIIFLTLAGFNLCKAKRYQRVTLMYLDVAAKANLASAAYRSGKGAIGDSLKNDAVKLKAVADSLYRELEK